MKRWIYHPEPSRAEVEELGRAINVNPCLAAILVQRGITDYQKAKDFFRPFKAHLHDPFLMKDMDKAVARLHKAIENRERILIYGDYDVDGTTAVALVYLSLKHYCPDCEIYIPDRHSEGYGISKQGVTYAAENGFTLVIALDCGIKAREAIALATEKGVEFIICDHHLPGEEIPQAVAVLDPKQDDCHYPYSELSGCGLGFKLMQAFMRKHGDEEVVFNYIDLVAVSIASDIVPITGENRVMATLGLNKLNNDPLPGLKALKEISGLQEDLDVSVVVFTLGPRINAAGRVAHARSAVELLVSESFEEAKTLAERIDLKNELRREFDQTITEEALAMIENNAVLKEAKSTVLFKEDWHKGVIGIVASRCIERFYRPTIILTASEDRLTGSARSVHGFDVYEAIASCSDLLDRFGGHKYAAGLTLLPENLEAFRARFEEFVSMNITEDMLVPVIEIDSVVNFEQITPKFFNILRQMAPFGPGNSNPVFETRDVEAVNSLTMFKDRHIRFLAKQRNSERTFPVVGFDMAAYYERLSYGDTFSLAYSIVENVYKGTRTLQLRAKDIHFDSE